ncbi:helix-turn-helix transcriptional regulator [Kyrpidia spormannii]|uniref:Transcriptional regulator n=2 Tax=Kyrpidia spormannii TaxID=2055160 RepID=A0ACA8ZCB4_9BACL|nr:helix-turn-helix domain-containing protein [Kyrpidia spormannii]CAB3391660.1 Transcriptional regulator [Kyrpidia spormannii]CAB3392573.1 Transcriptional regulator [Kyrpidia spormannii]
MLTRMEVYRRNAGMSQAELANRLGVSASSITQIERGYRKPWPKIRRSVAEYFGVQESDIFDCDGWPLKVELETRKLG